MPDLVYDPGNSCYRLTFGRSFERGHGWGMRMHRGLIREQQQDHSHGFFLSIPSGKVIPLASMAFVFFLTEGAIYDWSGVFLRIELGVGLAAASPVTPPFLC